MEMNIEELRKIQRKERKLSLSQLPDDFYESVANLLESLEKEKKWNEKENCMMILKDIYERRREKIIKAALNYSIANKPAYMTKYEEEFYNSILELIKKDEENFLKVINRVVKEEEIKKREEIKIEEKLKVKIYFERDVDKFIGVNGRIYGPYKKGDIIEVDPSEASLFIKLKVAKEIS